MQFKAQARFATKMYFYTLREQMSEATKKCADSISSVIKQVSKQCNAKITAISKFPNRIDGLVLHGSTPYGAYT